YLDGQLQTSAPLTAHTVLSSGLTLGPGGGNSEGHEYDEFAIYPTALSAQAIDKHWSAGASPQATACAAMRTSPRATSIVSDRPAAYYRLNDLVSSPVAYDSSGNCANAAYANISTPVGGALASNSAEQGVETPTNGQNEATMASSAGLPSGNSART